MHRFIPIPNAVLLLALAAVPVAPGGASAQPRPTVAIPRATVGLNEQCTAAPGVLPEIASSGGVLRDSLTMDSATYELGGRQLTSNVYNGSYNAPTLRVGLGEQVELRVTNRLRAVGGLTEEDIKSTNQHYHGLVVTPIPTAGDNVTHVSIRQDSSNLNRFSLLQAVDSVQSEGLMWYHPHPHGHTSPQVAGGLAGALVVGDLLGQFPDYKGATEQILVIKSAGDTLNVNGVECPRLTIGASTAELWRILNATGNTFLNLKLEGYTFTVLAFDGNKVPAPIDQDSLFIPPGGRVEAIVTGGVGAWVTNLVAAPFLGSGLAEPVKIAEVHTVGVPEVSLADIEARAAAARSRINHALADSIRRLATATDVDTFTLRYSFGARGALLNGRVYRPTRLDRAVAVGRVQEWTLINRTVVPHTFHIHQTDFLVTKINGDDVELDSVFHDNVTVGVHRDSSGRIVGDTVKVRFAFHPVAVGPFVYHCHVLGHEDAGMMQNICVYDPDNGGETTCTQWFPGAGRQPPGGHAH